MMEPLLIAAAAKRGAKIRFDTEYLSSTQDAEGVTTTVKDHLTGAVYTIRSRYLIGADGANSRVVADYGLPLEGRMGVSGSMNIVFDCDLSRYRSEEHTSELQSLMRISYAVFCLKKKKKYR